MDPTELAAKIADLALERKALDVTIVDVRGRSSYTDYIIIASGTSDRHVQAVAEQVRSQLSHAGTPCLGREGLREGQWALIDFGSVVLHVFHQFTRDAYRLEEMWSDAPQRRVVPPPPREAPLAAAYAP